MSRRERVTRRRPASATRHEHHETTHDSDIRELKNYYKHYKDAETSADEEYDRYVYTTQPVTEKERRVTEYVYGQNLQQSRHLHQEMRDSRRRINTRPPPVRYSHRERRAWSASGHPGEYQYYDDYHTDDVNSYQSQPVAIRERDVEGSRRPHSYHQHNGENVKYTYNDGKSVVSEDVVSQMSNVVIKDRYVEKPVYIEPQKQFRNVGVQMTTNYVAEEPPKIKIKRRTVSTQTKPPPPKPRSPSPTPPPTPRPPSPKVEIIQVERKPEPETIYVTVPVKEDPLPVPVREEPAYVPAPVPAPPPRQESEPVIIPLSEIRMPAPPPPKKENDPAIIVPLSQLRIPRRKKQHLVRVGGGWVTRDYYKNKYYPLRIVEMDQKQDRLKDRYLFVKSSGTRRRRYLQDLSYDMYRERPKTIPDYPI